MTRHLGAKSGGDIAHGRFEFRGAEIVGRDVDQVAAQPGGCRDRDDILLIDAFGQPQPAVAALAGGLIVLERIMPECPGKRRQLRIVETPCEMIVARRKQRRQASGMQRARRGAVFSSPPKTTPSMPSSPASRAQLPEFGLKSMAFSQA